jgi:hypothetical protein
MTGNHTFSARAAFFVTALFCTFLFASDLQAYRICTFKGTVVEHGWRTMTVRTGGQCARVNVSWRTKYIPNRRPCIGERVAVDFMLEDGYMKATRVVSLTPTPASVECYPPPPPSTAVCRSVAERAEDVCPAPRPICSRRPPSYVTDRAWKPHKKPKKKRAAKKPEAKKPPEAAKPPPPPPPPPPPQAAKSLTGEVVASSPKSLSIRVTQEGEAPEVVRVKVGLKTRFIPFRRPAVGEKVKVDYVLENGSKFGNTVQVIQ